MIQRPVTMCESGVAVIEKVDGDSYDDRICPHADEQRHEPQPRPLRLSPLEEGRRSRKKTRLSSLCRVSACRGNLIRWAASAAASPSGALRRLRGRGAKGERVSVNQSPARAVLSKELVRAAMFARECA